MITHPPLIRASLDSTKHSSVDVFLKSLKLHTRTLSALFAQHATELAVLERLYYINNNQHRPALFWQRIAEARRYSRRLRVFNVPSLVDGFRRSFHGDMTDGSSKLKKGSWTHYPSVPSLKSFLARLRTCTTLLDKTCVRMRAIYQMLTLAIQSGAFLHLVVTLTALVARLAHLSSAIRRALSTLHSECLRLLVRLHPATTPRNLAPLQLPPSPELEDMNTPGLLLEGLNRGTLLDGDLDVSVDLGEAVARTPMPTTPRPKSRSTSLVLPDYFSLAHDSTLGPVIGAQQPSITLPTSAHKPSLDQAVIVKNRAGPSATPRGAEEPKEEKRQNKARKKRRDEIDEIFS